MIVLQKMLCIRLEGNDFILRNLIIMFESMQNRKYSTRHFAGRFGR